MAFEPIQVETGNIIVGANQLDFEFGGGQLLSTPFDTYAGLREEISNGIALASPEEIVRFALGWLLARSATAQQAMNNKAAIESKLITMDLSKNPSSIFTAVDL